MCLYDLGACVYIYIYIYICMCVCVCARSVRARNSMSCTALQERRAVSIMIASARGVHLVNQSKIQQDALEQPWNTSSCRGARWDEPVCLPFLAGSPVP